MSESAVQTMVRLLCMVVCVQAVLWSYPCCVGGSPPQLRLSFSSVRKHSVTRTGLAREQRPGR